MVITIDGTSGSGKSTTGKLVAKELHCAFLSSGEIYRAITVIIMNSKVDISNETQILKELSQSKIEIKDEDNLATFYINGIKALKHELHSPQVSNIVPKIAPFKRVREFARNLQHQFANQEKTIVVEGRDVGSVVFPNADYKFYITADLEIRARRRFEEYKSENNNVTYENVYASLKTRDYADETRKLGKLVIPNNAIVIDTSHITLNEAVNQVLSHIKY